METNTSLWFCHRSKPWVWLRPLSAQKHWSGNAVMLWKHFKIVRRIVSQWLSCCLQAENSPTEKLFIYIYKTHDSTQCRVYGKAPTYLKEPLVTQTFSHTHVEWWTSWRSLKTKCPALVMELSAGLLWNALPDHLRAPQTEDSFQMSQSIFPPRLCL